MMAPGYGQVTMTTMVGISIKTKDLFSRYGTTKLVSYHRYNYATFGKFIKFSYIIVNTKNISEFSTK